MRQVIASLAAGVLFGLGLTVSGMVNPQKVLNFLDLFGYWDPTLAFVMGGALVVTIPGFHLLQRRRAPLLDTAFHFPTRADLDRRLIGGSLLFGVGWGATGVCPGPAVTALGVGVPTMGVFVVGMLGGMVLHRIVMRLQEERRTEVADG